MEDRIGNTCVKYEEDFLYPDKLYEDFEVIKYK